MNLVDGDALVGLVQHGVVEVGVHVALGAHDFLDTFVAETRPTVGCEHHVSLLAITVQGDVDMFGPNQRITHQGAAQGVDIVNGAGDVFCRPEGLELRKVGVHLGGRLGSRRALELHLDTVDGQRLEVFLDVAIGLDQPQVSRRGVLAD